MHSFLETNTMASAFWMAFFMKKLLHCNACGFVASTVPNIFVFDHKSGNNHFWPTDLFVADMFQTCGRYFYNHHSMKTADHASLFHYSVQWDHIIEF